MGGCQLSHPAKTACWDSKYPSSLPSKNRDQHSLLRQSLMLSNALKEISKSNYAHLYQCNDGDCSCIWLGKLIVLVCEEYVQYFPFPYNKYKILAIVSYINYGSSSFVICLTCSYDILNAIIKRPSI